MKKKQTACWRKIGLALAFNVLVFFGTNLHAGETSLALDSQGGDYVGQGQQLFFTLEGASFFAQRNFRNGVSIVVRTPSVWALEFAAPENQPLVPGQYVNATKFETLSTPALVIGGEGRGCNRTLGAFQVKEVSYGPGETIDAFWAIFEQHCERALPALFGEIRFNANVIVTVTAPPKRVVEQGQMLTFTVSANDASGNVTNLTATGVPPTASFTDNRDNTGTFTWTPNFDELGTFVVGFHASNDQGATDSTATVINVGTLIHVPADIASIQGAIDSALDGSRVLVAPGTYHENINFRGKSITIISEQGPAVTIINGNQADSVVTFNSGEDEHAVIEGFTLTDGKSDLSTPGFGDGGGIRILYSSPRIRRNFITENKACSGAGISIVSSSPSVERNTITGNSRLTYCVGGVGGGGISVVHGPRVKILDNIISNNLLSGDGGGISLFYARTPTIHNNIISRNVADAISVTNSRGGGIAIFGHSDALITQNLIVGNRALSGGGIYWAVDSNRGGPVLVNNTIADNDSGRGSGIYALGFDVRSPMLNNIVVARTIQTAVYCDNANGAALPVLRFNNVFSPSGSAYGGACVDQTGIDGNISKDPSFADPLSIDYRLNPGSPSVDTGDNSARGLPLTDLAGGPRIVDGDADGEAVIDMGAYEFSPSPL